MSTYTKPMKCERCGFIEKIEVRVSGDFDDWEPSELIQSHTKCPFCKHLKKLGFELMGSAPYWSIGPR